ncbi:MAG: 2OG-Fe(II) oxygenase, partial [Steroidobacteraceae bacterium]
MLPRSDTDRTLAARLQELESATLQRRFSEQGQFLYLPEFLPASITAQLVAAVEAVGSAVNRNYLPRHKQGG